MVEFGTFVPADLQREDILILTTFARVGVISSCIKQKFTFQKRSPPVFDGIWTVWPMASIRPVTWFAISVRIIVFYLLENLSSFLDFFNGLLVTIDTHFAILVGLDVSITVSLVVISGDGQENEVTTTEVRAEELLLHLIIISLVLLSDVFYEGAVVMLDRLDEVKVVRKV